MRLRASNLDRAFAGNAVLYLVGPLRSLEEPNRLRERLAAIAGGGPTNRLGLAPDKAARRWRFDPGCSSIAVTSGPAPDMTDPCATLARLDAAASDVPSVPAHVHLAAPWLFLKFDHGLGGGRLFTELIAAIGSDDPGWAQPVPNATCRFPGTRATVHTLRRHPVRLLAGLREVGTRHEHSNTIGVTTGDVSVAYARSDPHYLERVRQARDSHMPGVSSTALITSHFLHRLHAAGIPTEQTVNFMVDMGRYLPSGCATLSNFVGTAPIDLYANDTAKELSDSLAAYTRGCRALVRLGMAYATTIVFGPPGNILYRANNARARIVVTDHANTTAGRKIDWAPSAEGHVFVRKAPVGFTNQITLAINRIHSELHVTASFYEPYFDAAKVQRILESTASTHCLDEYLDVAG